MFETLTHFVVAKTLAREWWRSDALWTSAFLNHWPFNTVPYLLDRWALKHSTYWSREQLDALTETRLAHLCAQAARIPFWKTVFLQHPHTGKTYREYLTQLPIISRSDFKTLPIESYCDRALLATSLRDRTSGSTGVPFTFFLDRGTLLALWAIRDRQCYVASRGIRYPLVIFRADIHLQKRFYKPHFVYLRGYHDVAERFGALEEKIMKRAPHGAVLYMFPSSAVALGRFMEESGKTLPLKALVATGESVPPDMRAYIEKTLGAPVALAYGSQESSCIAFECERGSMHINEEDVLVEIVDAEGKPLPDGVEGKVVVTHLGYRVMPFIRYHNGDQGTIGVSACLCGCTLKTITITGRTPTLISHRDGYTLTLTEVSALFNEYANAVQLFQIVHKAPDRIHVCVVPGPEYAEEKERLAARLARKLHPETHLTIEEVAHIETSASGKMRYYVREF